MMVFDPIALVFCCFGIIGIVVIKAFIVGRIAERDMKFILGENEEYD